MNNHKTDHQTIAMKHIIHISSQMSTTIIMLKYSLAFGVAAREERKVPIFMNRSQFSNVYVVLDI